jgi:hypothetical protein
MVVVSWFAFKMVRVAICPAAVVGNRAVVGASKGLARQAAGTAN